MTEAIAGGVDAAFVHSATESHPAIVTELIEAGVPVFVDKPLSYRLEEAEALVELARDRGVPLMVGFNRRYAPGIAALRDLPRDLIILQKNRHTQPEDPRRMVFDDFIHVADTLRFLAPGEVTETSIRIRARGTLLEHVVLELSGDGFTAIGMMSRVSGQTEETCEVIGRGEKRKVLDLGDEVTFTEDGETRRRRPDWVSVGTQRGFTGRLSRVPGCGRRGQAARRGRRAGDAPPVRADRRTGSPVDAAVRVETLGQLDGDELVVVGHARRCGRSTTGSCCRRARRGCGRRGRRGPRSSGTGR